MSVMHCTGCDRYVDTDFNVEGVFDPRAGKTGYWCDRCIERGEDSEMLAALLVDRPEQYKNCHGCKCVVDNEADPDCYDSEGQCFCERCRDKHMEDGRALAAEHGRDLARASQEKQDRQDIIDSGRGHLLPSEPQ